VIGHPPYRKKNFISRMWSNCLPADVTPQEAGKGRIM
jgi:hypothetical protein